MPTIRHILVPTDFSPPANEAARYAAELAAKLGAELTLLHVYQLPNYLLPDGTALLASAETAARVNTEVNEHLAQARAALTAPGLAVTTKAMAGEPTSEILRALEGGAHDLVIMGTRGRTGLPHLLLGSVAERVVRFAPVPVLTVHARTGS